MKKIPKIFALFVLLFSNLSAQDLANKVSTFSGTWILDKEKSSFGVFDDKAAYANYTLKISDDGTEFKVTKSYVYKGRQINHEIILFTDKRGETNIISIPDDSYKIESKTTRKANIVNRNYKFKIARKNLTNRNSGSEKYILSDDGKKLTLAVSNSFESYASHQTRPVTGTLTHKLIFDKSGN